MKKARASRIIMGLDPGYGRLGFGVIQVTGHEVQLLDYGVITSPQGLDFEHRLLQLGEDMWELVSQHKPELVAIEKLFFGKSSTTAMKVAHARGVAMMMVAKAGAQIVEYAPNQIKKALTGDGSADKRAMQQMVKHLLQLARVPKPDDAADAIAVALTASTKQW